MCSVSFCDEVIPTGITSSQNHLLTALPLPTLLPPPPPHPLTKRVLFGNKRRPLSYEKLTEKKRKPREAHPIFLDPRALTRPSTKAQARDCLKPTETVAHRPPPRLGKQTHDLRPDLSTPPTRAYSRSASHLRHRRPHLRHRRPRLIRPIILYRHPGVSRNVCAGNCF